MFPSETGYTTIPSLANALLCAPSALGRSASPTTQQASNKEHTNRLLLVDLQNYMSNPPCPLLHLGSEARQPSNSISLSDLLWERERRRIFYSQGLSAEAHLLLNPSSPLRGHWQKLAKRAPLLTPGNGIETVCRTGELRLLFSRGY